MKLLTGRTRTLTFSGPMSGAFSLYYGNGIPQVDEPTHPYASGSVSVSAPWGAAASIATAFRPTPGTYDPGNPPPYSNGPDYYMDCGVTITVADGFGGSSSGYAWNASAHLISFSPPTEWQWTWNWAATWTLSIGVEEVVEFSLIGWDASGHARWSCSLYERPSQGSTSLATVTIPGYGTWSQSHTLTEPGGSLGTIYSVGFAADYGWADMTGDIAASGAMTLGSGSEALSAAGAWSVGGCSVSCTSGVHISGDAPASGWSASAAASISPVRSYSIDGIVKAYDVDYPGTIVVTVDRTAQDLAHAFSVAGGSFADGCSQRHYDTSATINGTACGPASLHEQTTLRCMVQSASASSAGEDIDDLWLPFRCYPPWTALSIQHQDEWQIDACDDLTPEDELAGEWSAVGGGTVSVDSGIRINTAASGAQGLRRTFTDRWCNLSAGRYLRLETSGPYVAGIGVTLRTQDGATKTWTRDKNGAALNPAGGSIELDLANPDSATADTDIWDTRWPLPTVDGDYSGVTCLTQIDLSGLQNSQTYRVTSVEVFRQDRAEVTCMAARAGWEREQSATISENVTSDTYNVRGLLAVVDGVQSIEAPHAWKTVIHSSAGDTTTYGETEIRSLLNNDGNAELEPWPAHAGWTITGDEVADPAEYGDLQDWLNTNRGIGWLRGGGWMYEYDDGSWGWVDGCDLPAMTIAASLQGQVVVDTISWYPGCGDAFGFHASSPHTRSGALLCAAAAVLRGGAHGLVFDMDTRLPADDVEVTAHDTDQSEDSGTGTSDTDGWYETGTPQQRGQHQMRVSVDGSQAVTLGRNRARRRVVLHSQTVPSWISYDVSHGWRQLAAYVQAGTIRVLAATNMAGSAWNIHDTGIAGKHPCVRVHRQSAGQGLWLSYEPDSGGTVQLACSYNEGRGWGAGIAVSADGQYPVVVLTEDGRLYVYWRTAAGALRGVLLDSHLNTLMSEFTVVASGVDDSPITAAEYLTGAGVWAMRLVYTAGGALYQAVSPTGVAFGTPTSLAATGKCPAVVHTADRRLLLFYVEAGTGVQSRMYDLHGNALHDAVLVTSVGSMDCLAADEVMTGRGAWAAHLYYPGGANPPGYVTTDGVTFTAIA